MPKIIHFHYNIKRNVNIGDEAHVLSIQDSLVSRIDDLNIINLPISFLSQHQLPKWVKAPVFVSNIVRLMRGMTYCQLVKELNQSDMVVIGGGGVYMDPLLPYNTDLIDEIDVPIAIIGAGYNHNFGSKSLDNRQLSSVAELGEHATLHSVRDANTQLFLKNIGTKSELMCDPAIFLDAIQSDSIKRQKDAINIGINIAAHGWTRQQEFQDVIIESYIVMMKSICESRNVNFYYFVHHPGELAVVNEFIKSGVKLAGVINTDARRTKGVYGQMDISISMMLHSLILAFGEGVPTLAVGYDDKNLSFMKMVSQSDSYIDVNNLSPKLLTEKTFLLIESFENKKLAIEKDYLELLNKYNNFMDKVISQITQKVDQ